MALLVLTLGRHLDGYSVAARSGEMARESQKNMRVTENDDSNDDRGIIPCS